MENSTLHHGEIFKKILKDRGLTDIEISKILGISRQSVNELYKRGTIKRSRLLEICGLLKIDISNFGEVVDMPQTEIVLLKELVEIQREQIKLLKEKIAFLEGTK